MKMKKIPMRSCVITKERLPKQELIRIVRTSEGEVVVDLSGKKNGRGIYLKKDKAVFERAQKTKVLSNQLGVSIPETIFEELSELLK